MSFIEDIDYSALSIEELQSLLRFSAEELHSRAVEDEDPEHLVQEVLRRTNLSRTGRASAPVMVTPNVVALTGIVKDVGKVKHQCSLYTVKLPDVVESWWAWDDIAPTYIYSESTKIGGLRYTVSLHTAVSDMRMTMHTRSFDGQFHQGKSAQTHGLELVDGKMQVQSVPTLEVGKLPLPTDMDD